AGSSRTSSVLYHGHQWGEHNDNHTKCKLPGPTDNKRDEPGNAKLHESSKDNIHTRATGPNSSFGISSLEQCSSEIRGSDSPHHEAKPDSYKTWMENHAALCDELGFNDLWEVPGQGKSGGIVLLWNTNLVTLTYLRQSEQELHATIQGLQLALDDNYVPIEVESDSVEVIVEEIGGSNYPA
ncbi:hypothetical protein HAX54_006722, partial [Datura stramonium]|nr:hypothetical protein [Datura stramonium]